MKQFLTISEASAQLGLSEATVYKYYKGIQKHIPDRYTPSDIIDGGKKAVRFVALQDYATYENHIDSAPPYDPVEREKELGISEYIPVSHITAHDVAVEIFRMFVKASGVMDL